MATAAVVVPGQSLWAPPAPTGCALQGRIGQGAARLKPRFTAHARRRMARYGIGEDAVVDALRDPDSLLDGHSGRRIAQKRLNHYVLRVIFEDEQDGPVVVTVYRAKRDRYEV